MDCEQARTRCRKAKPASRIAPLKPTTGLNGPPATRRFARDLQVHLHVQRRLTGDHVWMKSLPSKHISNSWLITCAFAGAFVGFLLPSAKVGLLEHSGRLASIIDFELGYLNLITTCGGAVLLYWLLTRKTRGAEGMIICGGLGFVSIRLLLASISYLRGVR